jgi:hypothetical protein
MANGRIRSIKPELWDNPRFCAMSPNARLLYLAMQNYADDFGVGTCAPRDLMGSAFPYDETMTLGEFRGLLGEIRRKLGVEFYAVDERPYYLVPTWEKDQKVDKRSLRRNPLPADGEWWDPEQELDADQLEEFYASLVGGSSAGSRRVPGVGTEEQRSRGTEEQRTEEPLTADAVEPEPAAPVVEPEQPAAEPEPDAAVERLVKADSRGKILEKLAEQTFPAFYELWPKKVARPKALAAWRQAVKVAGGEVSTIMAGAKTFLADDVVPDELQYVPAPSVWLNQQRWLDDFDVLRRIKAEKRAAGGPRESAADRNMRIGRERQATEERQRQEALRTLSEQGQ